jgi:hypothetical protein
MEWADAKTIEDDFDNSLIREDNLARGEFVQSVNVSASKRGEDKTWQIDKQELNSTLRDDDPQNIGGVGICGEITL